MNHLERRIVQSVAVISPLTQLKTSKSKKGFFCSILYNLLNVKKRVGELMKMKPLRELETSFRWDTHVCVPERGRGRECVLQCNFMCM